MSSVPYVFVYSIFVCGYAELEIFDLLVAGKSQIEVIKE